MSATIYNNELSHIISESKRKNNELRSAAETSLQDLKSITITSEQQLAADLSRRTTFVEPFLKACATGQAKFAISGVNGLQRLIISQGLPRSRLNEALLALNVCAELGLELQLKVLQALPSLVQNYSEELRGDLLGSALQVCAALQGAKVSTVSAVAAATLEQLVAAVFGRLAEEDDHAADDAPVVEVPGRNGNFSLKPAAHDAYRVLRDLVLAAEGRRTKFVQLSTLSREECLELIKSCLEAQPHLIDTHEELAEIISSNVMPLLTASISENLPFATTVRCIRLLAVLILYHFETFTAELEVAFGLFAHAIETDTPPIWKRILLMEILRDIFNEHGLIIKAYIAFDRSASGKPVIQDTLAAFVRLSSEKPAVIGLGQQSSVPTGPSQRDDTSDLSMASVLSSIGVVETNIQGVSEQWSIPKAPCYDQLDKTEAPALPDTYIYSLVLQCLNGLSDSLARIAIPLSVPQDQDGYSIPLNPLTRGDQPSESVLAVAGLIETCWPAVLAACSTFMSAALDDAFYRSLIKTYQRFTQVAGLLRLTTPRDALMTTLGKSAVPPQVLNAATDTGRSPVESPRNVSSPKSLLSIDGLVGQATSLSIDKDRRSSADTVKAVLTVRNLLCLRALLNLAIALGPTLDHAFAMVLEVVKHADIVLGAGGGQPLSRVNSSSDPPAVVQSFSSEVTAVENAASRLLESTADYPNDAFVIVLEAFCDMLRQKSSDGMSSIAEAPKSPASPPPRQRTFSGLPGLSVYTELRSKNLQFALPKLGTLAALNVSRFVSTPPDQSGWQQLSQEVLAIVISNSNAANARRSAADILTRLTAECISEVSQEDEDLRKAIQHRCFSSLLDIINGIYDEDGELTSVDLEIQSHVINCIKTILERSGDSIVSGWDKIIAILSTTFESEKGALVEKDEYVEIVWKEVSDEFVALRLGRDAFSTIQLICAEFFASTPVSVRGSIIELLYRFMRQTEDLNLSLTAITISWNVADLLFGSKDEIDITQSISISQLEEKLWITKDSSLAQWILLLVKLRHIVSKGQRETARAAFQTICSISKGNGAQLSPAIWDVIFRHILVGVLADDATAKSSQERALTRDLLSGFSSTIADQIEQLAGSSSLNNLWTELIEISSSMLARSDVEISTSIYTTLADILSNVEETGSEWKKPLDQVATLWTNENPSVSTTDSRSNQALFIAYASLANQMLRLKTNELETSLVKAVINNLCNCIKQSDATVYSADSQSLSQLQTLNLGTLKSIPRKIEQVPALLLSAAAELIFLPVQSFRKIGTNNKPSFVALAAEIMPWMQELILESLANERLSKDALLKAVTSLSDVIEEKYRFQVDHKNIPLWRRATSIAVAISKPVLDTVENWQSSEKIDMWKAYISITRNIVHANGLESFQSIERTYVDEQSDIAAFRELQKAIVPMLGAVDLPDDLLQMYSNSLFEASIIHNLERGEISFSEPLANIEKIRRGRSKHVPPSRREEMSYECFTHMIELTNSESSRLAKSIAPLLVVRLAIPIRTYIADQPLRGQMPQPLSDLEELLYSFGEIKKLRLNPELLSSRSSSNYLYPLLAKAVRVAGDQWCGTEEVLLPLQDVLASLEI
ncbi:hypothetical protein MRB53_042301 [Persea americana]|nr:hypothetical protein MRB53_042301 [Persea americana]